MITLSYIALGLLGLVFGSFVNALVWRLHEQSKIVDRKKAPARKKPLLEKVRGNTKKQLPLTMEELSIVKGRSMCPSCHHTLSAKDLVPVLSWVTLHGKCRYCGAVIPDNPLPELVTAALFIASYVALRPTAGHWTIIPSIAFVSWLIFIVLFVALAVYDLRWFLLPDKIVAPTIGLAIFVVIIESIIGHSFSMLWQPLLGGIIIFGLFYGLFQVSKGAWIGGGDVKLVFALGIIAGSPLRAFLLLFLSSLLGTLASIPILLRGKKGLKVHIPFGPYLLLATIIVGLYGTAIIHWYQSFFIAGY